MKTTLPTIAAIFSCSASALLATNIPATEDSYIAQPKNTFTGITGKSPTLLVAPTARALVKFEIEGLGIPSNQVQRAFLRVYINSVKTTGEIEFRSLAAGGAGSWSEDAAKNVAGPALDPAAGAVVSVPDKKKRFVTVDVTDLVKLWLTTPSTNNGVAIVSKNGVANIKLGSKEGFGTGYPAELEIESNPILPLFTGGNPNSGTLDGSNLLSGSVGSSQLGASTVTNSALASDAVSTSKLADGSVTNPKLADGSVTNPKLADGSVSSAKLGVASVGSSAIADGSVGTDELTDNAITTVKLEDSAITSSKIATSTIQGVHISDATVGIEKLASRRVAFASTAGLGNIARSAIANQTSSSTTAIAITNLSVTLTTSGRPVRLELDGADADTAGYIYVGPGAGAGGTLEFYRGATKVASRLIRLDGASGVYLPASAFGVIDAGGGGGTNTYTVRFRADSATMEIKNIRLLAYEL